MRGTRDVHSIHRGLESARHAMWASVGPAASDGAQGEGALLDLLRAAEVNELEVAHRIKEQVLWLDVAMRHAARVQVPQGTRDHRRVQPGLGFGHLLLPLRQRAEVREELPARHIVEEQMQQLRAQKRPVDRLEEGMVALGEQLALAQDRVDLFVGNEPPLVHRLERVRAAASRVLDELDGRNRAHPDQLHHAQVVELYVILGHVCLAVLGLAVDAVGEGPQKRLELPLGQPEHRARRLCAHHDGSVGWSAREQRALANVLAGTARCHLLCHELIVRPARL